MHIDQAHIHTVRLQRFDEGGWGPLRRHFQTFATWRTKRPFWLKFDPNPLCFSHMVDCVEGSRLVPRRISGFAAELPVCPLDIHEKPRRRTPMAIGAELYLLGRLQCREPVVEALPRFFTNVMEIRLHLDYPFNATKRAVARDNDLWVELNKQVEALKPFFE